MTEVVMPQMGESIAEGTIVRWVKQVGDTVERDEPLFEISTDKVDAEIPSPAAGVLTEIRAKEGETVPVNSVVALIAPAGTKAAAPAPAAAPAAQPKPAAEAPKPAAETPKAAAPAPSPSAAASPAAATPSTPPPSSAPVPESSGVKLQSEDDDDGDDARQRTSPLVRKIAKEHHVDLSKIAGTGLGGRVTKNDILGYLAGKPSAAGGGPSSATKPAAAVVSAAASKPAAPAAAKTGQPLATGAGLAGQTVPMSVMRKKIAEHMVASKRTSAHVHSVFEVNFHKVDQLRQANKAEYENQGAKLTYLSFILRAVVDALKIVPVINASVDGDNIVYHKTINLGVAVALDWGLIVPVIKNADQKSLLELSRSVVDLATRARAKQLKPDEVSGGTFTITNPGVFGALFGMPIINQPQLAILGVGAIEKRPVVIDDAIAIRPMAYLGIGYDHRVIDGAVADEFMSEVKKIIEAGKFQL
jgi:pyruvate dehydrogenase E2 component (dihydrolipoamide acetyltransferase)